MRKPLFIGASLGLLLLGIVAAVLWMTGKASPIAAPAAPTPAAQRRVPPSADVLQVPTSIAQVPSREAAQERRRRLAQVRAEFNALRAKGMQASAEKMRALIDELEALSSPGVDPRYFQALRNMLDTNAKVLALQSELQALSSSQTASDRARQEAILVEMRVLGERAVVEAQNLQAYAPTAVSKSSAP